jgi:PH domain associated with Beige/BEACH
MGFVVWSGDCWIACLQPLTTADGVFVLGKLCSYFVDNFKVVQEDAPVGKGDKGGGGILPGLLRGKHKMKSVVAVSPQAATSASVTSKSDLGSFGGKLVNITKFRSWHGSPHVAPEPEAPITTTAVRRGTSNRATPDAKKSVAPSPPSSDALAVSHAVRLLKYDDVLSVHKRRYLLRHTAVEVFMADGRTLLLVLRSQDDRDEVYTQLIRRCPKVGPPHVGVFACISPQLDLVFLVCYRESGH